ncbi:uncharacterized protein METZ01_LOCUS203166, partial [marine metagenome]
MIFYVKRSALVRAAERMPADRIGRKNAGPAGKTGPPSQIHIFIVGYEIFVEPPDFVKNLLAIQPRATIRTEDFLDLVIPSVVRIAVAPVTRVEITGFNAYVYDGSRQFKTDDLGRAGPRVG